MTERFGCRKKVTTGLIKRRGEVSFINSAGYMMMDRRGSFSSIIRRSIEACGLSLTLFLCYFIMLWVSFDMAGLYGSFHFLSWFELCREHWKTIVTNCPHEIAPKPYISAGMYVLNASRGKQSGKYLLKVSIVTHSKWCFLGESPEMFIDIIYHQQS